VSVKHAQRRKPLEPLDPLDLPRPPTRGKQPLPAEAQKYVRSILYEDYETYARSRDSSSRREANLTEKGLASDSEKVSFGNGKRLD
jgi:hypothetical protein